MNGSAVTLSGQSFTAEDFYTEIVSLEKTLAKLKEKLLKMMPVKYGSDAWWEKSDKKSFEEYEQGKYKSFQNVKVLMRELNS